MTEGEHPGNPAAALGGPLSASWRFEPHPTAVRQVRRRVAECLSSLPEEELSVILVLVSELAGNAVAHSGTAFDVSLECDRDHLRIEVADEGPGEARILETELGEPNGRGLRIVEAFAGAWGVLPHSDGRRGKTVWFSLRLGG
jgi:anti-sigma regulatory factor (Ser/Thr protein kinase)